MARFATAMSQRATVIRLEAAKMIAYCLRNPGLVRSIFVLSFWISSSIFCKNQMFASVSFWSRNPRGSFTKSIAALASHSIGM